MKQIPVRFFVLCFSFLAPFAAQSQEKAASPKTVKILTIGNSFAGNAMSFFPKMVESAGNQVMIFKANPGGCSLEKHANWAKAYDANPEDPAGKPYGADFYPPRKQAAGLQYSLRQALEAEKWDVVTLQQVSDNSYKGETFEPFAGSLVEYVHKYAPQAKILLFQTWAFREDWPGFGKDVESQAKMYELLAQNYEKLAADYNLQVIPVGYAFQKARGTERWTFKYPDPNFDYKNPAEGTVPNQPGSLNAGWGWWRPRDGGPDSAKFVLDQKHCNDDGRYLAGAVFYEALFGDVTKVTFFPDKMSPADATELRRIAHESFAAYPGKKATR